MKNNNLLMTEHKKKNCLIAVHRGSAGGNIIENTIPAYEAAIKQGGDILEIDVIKSIDGDYFCFHDGYEERLLNTNKSVFAMTAAEILDLNYYNSLNKKNHAKMERLEDVLNYYKGTNVIINIDRAWYFFDTLLPFLEKFDMLDQIIIKSPVNDKIQNLLCEFKTKFMFMPIVKTLPEFNEVLNYENINLVALELIANSSQHELFCEDLIKQAHDLDLLVWANALVLDDDTKLFAGFDDDISIKEAPEKGWGKLFQMNIDIIQTDWPAILSNYRDSYFKSNK